MDKSAPILSISTGSVVLLAKKIVDAAEIMLAAHASLVTHSIRSTKTVLRALQLLTREMWVVHNAAIKLLRLLLSVLHALT